jgi:1-acyl-sn-glycerol-3-phosphate acyltransferase
LPRTGPAILVSNHISGLDPLVIQSLCPRLIVWMVAREYYEISALKWFFRSIEAIPVERGSRDIASTRQALRALHDGRVLGVFPEGRIEPGMELLPFHTGVALMATRTGVPVYPVYLDGTPRGGGSMLSKFCRRQRALVGFGPAIPAESLTRAAGLDAGTATIRETVRALQAQISAQKPNFASKMMLNFG